MAGHRWAVHWREEKEEMRGGRGAAELCWRSSRDVLEEQQSCALGAAELAGGAIELEKLKRCALEGQEYVIV